MRNQHGEWIADAERSEDNGAVGDTSDSFIFTDTSAGKGADVGGPWDWEVEAESSWTRAAHPDTLTSGGDLIAIQTGDSYAGSHALYQDLTVPH